MSEDKSQNLMRGIAVYANPYRELANRRYVVEFLARTGAKVRVEAIEHMVKAFGRETVRAVVGPEGA